jgi:hypothetical protein
MVLLHAMLAPFDQAAATAEHERNPELVGVLLQHAQVELDQVPADDCVGVVPREPRIEPLQHLRAALAVFEVEIARGVVAVRRAEHVHLTLAAAFQRDRIEIAALARLDVERHHRELRPVAGRRSHFAVE